MSSFIFPPLGVWAAEAFASGAELSGPRYLLADVSRSGWGR